MSIILIIKKQAPKTTIPTLRQQKNQMEVQKKKNFGRRKKEKKI